MHTAEVKVTADHLRRDAYLYVRQSTPRQVVENVESTQRQYALRDRAVAAGWPAERIHVIDKTSASPAPARPRGMASSASSARLPWARPASSWGWRSPVWPATPPIGIV
jgi:hypothetical protein